MVFRGRVWRITWRDTAGKVHWDNAGTGDAREAQRLLAHRALPRAKAMVKALEAIIHGTPFEKTEAAAAEGQGGTGDRAQHGAGRGSVRVHVALGGDRGTTRGGKR